MKIFSLAFMSLLLLTSQAQAWSECKPVDARVLTVTKIPFAPKTYHRAATLTYAAIEKIHCIEVGTGKVTGSWLNLQLVLTDLAKIAMLPDTRHVGLNVSMSFTKPGSTYPELLVLEGEVTTDRYSIRLESNTGRVDRRFQHTDLNNLTAEDLAALADYSELPLTQLLLGKEVRMSADAPLPWLCNPGCNSQNSRFKADVILSNP